jgi:FkbM family methyltransferase
VSEKSSAFFIHQVTHNNQLIFFQSTVRINRFIKGFEHAGKRMWNRYKIDELLCGVEPGTIIDIGANIGEFSFYAHKKYIEKVEIFTFDPDPITKECIDNNLIGINASINLVALSNKSGEEDFYLKTESADSSLHEPFGESVKIKTKIVTLDSFFDNLERALSDQAGSFRINGSFSHFILDKSELIEVGFFDERLLGLGEEDGDFYWRYHQRYQREIPNAELGLIENVQSDLADDGYTKGIRTAAKFNRDFMQNVKYKPTILSGYRGMFDHRVKKALEDERQYPYEQFYLDNKDKI